jgi:hypothetical protein
MKLIQDADINRAIGISSPDERDKCLIRIIS